MWMYLNTIELYILKNGQDGKFYVVCNLPQWKNLKLKKKNKNPKLETLYTPPLFLPELPRL